MTGLTAPFFEIGPKNLLRRPELEELARIAGKAGQEFGVCVILTVPTAMVAPIHDLGSGVLVFGQGMDPDPLGPSLGRVTAESLADAGATGVMLNHTSNPLAPQRLAEAVGRAHATCLQTIVCVDTSDQARALAYLAPTAMLLEPPALIGTTGEQAERDWIAPVNETLRREAHDLLLMHAGGVSGPAVARSIMALGADGTGSTSGVLSAAARPDGVRAFIAATREGWDASHP